MTLSKSEATLARRPTAIWLWTAGVVGLGWNAFGAVRFIEQATSTRDHLVQMGMSSLQADLYVALPDWMNIVFAVGVFGGIAGSILLLLRRQQAVAVFAASLAGYLALFIGDISYGVFDAFGTPQVLILSTVVVIAAGLLWLAVRSRKQGLLR